MTKIAYFSDSHTLHDYIHIPECDILIFGGDATNRGSRVDFIDFFEWLRKQSAKHVIIIAGNHDLSLDKKLMLDPNQGSIESLLNRQLYYDIQDLIKNLPSNIHYLENSSIEIEGINFWGSPYSPTFGHDWAFNADRGSEISKIWSKIPKNTNVLITHSPCYSILDKVEERKKRYPDEDTNVGCCDLLSRIRKLNKLTHHLSGHIHENFGYIYKNVSNSRGVVFLNGAIVSNDNKLIHRYPLIFHI